jgi:hypothetical protein
MAKIDNIKIRQNWVAEQAEYYAKQLVISEDDAFQLLVTSLLLDESIEDINPEDIVDGGQDKQIDVIHIDDDQEKGYANLIIAQTKKASGFSSIAVIQVRNGLDWIFERPMKEVETLSNNYLVNKIKEIRELRIQYGASNISVSVYFATNGDKSVLSEEYLQESKILRDKYSTVGFDSFNYDELGAHEIMEIVNKGEKLKKQINLEIPIIYDTNRPSIMQFSQGDTKSFVCTISGKGLAEITSTEPRDAIFDLNVRPYYGSKGKVNQDIWNTCINEESERFWFLNNGITMVCDSFDFTQDPDNPIIKVKNAQIVNGCQTSVTIREAHEKHELKDNVKVLLRIYSTDNPNLVEKITLTTNNQNKVTDRDLRANDSVQRDIEKIMYERYGQYYERKNKQYRHLSGPNKRKIVPSPKAAQAYLAIVRRKPSNARGYLGAIWSDFYKEIFENATVGDLLLSYKIYKFCHKKSLESKNVGNLSASEIETRIYGVFHIARATGVYLNGDNWGNKYFLKIDELIKEVDEEDEILEEYYKKAVAVVGEIREEDKETSPIAAMYFKALSSQRKLNSKLDIEP